MKAFVFALAFLGYGLIYWGVALVQTHRAYSLFYLYFKMG